MNYPLFFSLSIAMPVLILFGVMFAVVARKDGFREALTMLAVVSSIVSGSLILVLGCTWLAFQVAT